MLAFNDSKKMLNPLDNRPVLLYLCRLFFIKPINEILTVMEIRRFGYYWLDTWVLANVIQLATQDFCMRYLNRKNDPCGRQYDQMTQAARSVPANYSFSTASCIFPSQ